MLRGEQNVALENKEQVEILKGMSAIQSGMSTPGGVVNYVSKRPKDVQSLTLEADSHGGSREHQQAFFDVMENSHQQNKDRQ